jgi:hypothetical protein
MLNRKVFLGLLLSVALLAMVLAQGLIQAQSTNEPPVVENIFYTRASGATSASLTWDAAPASSPCTVDGYRIWVTEVVDNLYPGNNFWTIGSNSGLTSGHIFLAGSSIGNGFPENPAGNELHRLTEGYDRARLQANKVALYDGNTRIYTASRGDYFVATGTTTGSYDDWGIAAITQDTGNTNTSFTITGLSSSKLYFYDVTALCGTAEGWRGKTAGVGGL